MRFVSFLLLLLWSSSGWGQSYETVVQGVSFNSASKVVLDQEAIRMTKAPDLTSLLSSQANIFIAKSNLQPGSLYLRGGDSSHVLILLDGLPIYDPSTIQKTTDLNSIDIKRVKRIEIVKGAQSVLYGGQALTGVIKIETMPRDAVGETRGLVELGANEYRKLSLENVRPLTSQWSVLARGQSAYANSRSPVLDSDFRYPQRLSEIEVGSLFRKDFDAFLNVSRLEKSDDISTTDLSQKAADTRDFTAGAKSTVVRTGVRGRGGMRPSLLAGYTEVDRAFEQPGALAVGEYYQSSLAQFRFEALPVDQEKIQLRAGFSSTRETFDYDSKSGLFSNSSTEKQGFFIKGNWSLSERVEVEAGARSDFEIHRDREDTFQWGLSLPENLKLEWAQGYNSPSLFQMYSVAYGGNPNLKAEKSRTISASWEHEWGSSDLPRTMSFAVFSTEFENLIQYTGAPPAGTYLNVGRAETRGFELGYTQRYRQGFRFDANIGYQEPWDVTGARWLLRRPLQTGSLRLTRSAERTSGGFETQWTGERTDRFGGGSFGNLSGYRISNAFLSYQINRNRSAFARANNVFNERFESSRGYFDPGLFFFFGFEIEE